MRLKPKQICYSLEFLACYWLILGVLPIGLLLAIGSLIEGGRGSFIQLAIAFPGLIGVVGTLSLLMELVSVNSEFPRPIQVSCTIVGIGVASWFLLYSIEIGSVYAGLFLSILPVFCAVHFLVLTTRLRRNRG